MSHFEKERKRMRKSNKKALAAVLLLLSGVGILIYRGFANTSIYYMTVDELMTSPLGLQLNAAQAVRVGGLAVDGSIDYNQRDLVLRFSVQDEDNPQAVLHALYNGAKPDAFEPGIEVLLEGTYARDKNLFLAETLLVKCPSKYESEQEKPQEAL
jgi:cytochrome c-type biogenesis protein CcmE